MSQQRQPKTSYKGKITKDRRWYQRPDLAQSGGYYGYRPGAAPTTPYTTPGRPGRGRTSGYQGTRYIALSTGGQPGVDMVQAGGLYGYGVTPVPPSSPFTPAGNYGYYAPGTAASGYRPDPRIGYIPPTPMTPTTQWHSPRPTGTGYDYYREREAAQMQDIKDYYRNFGHDKGMKRPPITKGYADLPWPEQPDYGGYGGYGGYPGYGGGGYTSPGYQAPYARQLGGAAPTFQYAGSPFARGVSPYTRPPDWARRLITWTGIGG